MTLDFDARGDFGGEGETTKEQEHQGILSQMETISYRRCHLVE